MSALLRKHNFDSVFDSQKMFRLILEAMANPGRIVRIEEYADKLFGDEPELLAVAVTLLDNGVSFSACESEPLSEEIAALTLAKRERPEAADFVFVRDLKDMNDAIESAKRGSLSDPYTSAVVILKDDKDPVGSLMLSGPGIDRCIEVPVSMAVKNALTLRDAQEYEYPQGIDLFFVSSDGRFLAVPRLTQIEAA
ncbi:MAG: phosphonate C-P lyase system protein PhnH [Clostridiales bacterium]|nr:phosphonate C-P lyase system protein PhnH [Clostridiales bacterium]